MEGNLMPKVSVIIPVYGVEKYIERCARSLFDQTLDSIEYIFVDDCSPDKSIDILKRVIEEFRPHLMGNKCSVRIERMPTNSGQAAVRRHGMQLCTAEYVAHCDSDDWVHPNMYKRLYEYAVSDDYDMVWCDFYRTDGNHHIYIKQQSSTKTIDIVGNLLAGSHSKLIGSVCNRLYKRRLQTGLIYPKDNMNEDLVLTMQLTIASHKIGYLPEALYYYYFNQQSICLNPKEDNVLRNLKGSIENNKILMKVIDRNGFSNSLSNQIISRKLSCRDLLKPLLGKRKYRNLWRNTFPEINKYIISNPYIPSYHKFRSFCLLYGCYPLYAFVEYLYLLSKKHGMITIYRLLSRRNK